MSMDPDEFIEDQETDPNASWLASISANLMGQQEAAERQLDLLASIALSINSTAKTLKAQERARRREMNQRMADQPVYRDFAQNLKCPASGVMVFQCGGPDVGRIWHVKRLVVGGLTLATAAAGTAEAYAGGYVSDTVGIPTSISDLHDATILISSPQTNLPNIGNYDAGQFTVMARAQVLGVVRGGTQNQIYVVAGTAQDLRVQPHPMVGTEG